MTLCKATMATLILLAGGTADPTIPMPDGIVYGTLTVDGEAVGPGSDYVVLARVDGIEAPVVVYRMGDLPAAGDNYLLRFPHRVESDGATPDPTTPPAGSSAELLVAKSGGPETHVGTVPVPASGEVVRMDVRPSASDALAGRNLNSAVPASGCGGGALCGTMGLISQGWIALGLMCMKASTRRRRRPT